MFLDPGVRRAMSAWSLVESERVTAAMDRLTADLAGEVWDVRWGELREQPTCDGALRLIVTGRP